MGKYRSHSNFAYMPKDEVAQSVNTGTLTVNDIVYTSDTNEHLFINSELEPVVIRSRLYRFGSVEAAETALNINKDTYEGQIVAIIRRDKYVGYIVNKKSDGKFTVNSLSETTSVDYDNVIGVPIEKLQGEIIPIVVGDLADGIYKVSGSYKIASISETTYISSDDILFLVRRADDVVYVKQIDAHDTVEYTISSSEIKKDHIITEEWLRREGLATMGQVEEYIARRGILTKDEATEMIEQIVTMLAEEKVQEQIIQLIATATEEDIVDIFEN